MRDETKARYHHYLAELAILASKTEARVADVMDKANMPNDAQRWRVLSTKSIAKAQRHTSIARTYEWESR